MDLLPPPLAFFVLLFSGWVNRQQQEVIDYLLEENRVLRGAGTPTPTPHRRPAPPPGRQRQSPRSPSPGVHRRHRHTRHPTTTVIGTGPITCRERLGGLLKFYHREA